MENAGIERLKIVSSEVSKLGSHNLSNGYTLKRLHEKAYNIILGLDTSNGNRYDDILTGMTDGNWYDLAHKNKGDYESGRKYLLTDIEDAIQRYVKNIELSAK